MPIRLTLYTEEEVRQLESLGAADPSHYEFCAVDNYPEWSEGLYVWSGHGDEDFARWLAQRRAGRSHLRLVAEG